MIKSDKNKYQIFLHQAEDDQELIEYVDFGNGYFMRLSEYQKYLSEGEPIEKIKTMGRRFAYLIEADEQEEMLNRSKNAIHNIKELLEFTYSLLDDDDKKRIKEARAKGVKTVSEIINYYPTIYQPLLRMRYEKDKKINNPKRIKETINNIGGSYD